MTWLALRLMLSGFASKLWAFLKSLSFWQIVCIGLALFLIVQRFELVHARSEAAKWHKQFTDEHAGRLSDRQAYVKAQADAAAKNKAQVAQTEQTYKRISDNEKDAYQRDHAELIRLRQQQLAAPKGPASPAGPSSPPAPTVGADGDGLRLSADQYLQAQEIELRLMHLQNYVDQLLKVDPNSP